MMKTKLIMQDVTPAVKSSVRAYLMARAYAETMRAAVNPVYRESLEIHPLYTDRDELRAPSRRKPKERILDVDKMYLSKDDETCKEVYADVNFQLRKMGLKPASMPDDHCPALVAEHIQVKTQWLLIECAAEMMGIENPKDFNNRLLCNGLETHRKFIDLVVGLVVNLPGFESPLRDGV